MKIDNLFWELLNNIWLFSYFLVISAFFLLKPFPLFWKAWLDWLQLIRANRARRISLLMQGNKLSQIIFLKSTGCVFLFFVFFFLLFLSNKCFFTQIAFPYIDLPLGDKNLSLMINGLQRTIGFKFHRFIV